jgi:hypothetical protein
MLLEEHPVTLTLVRDSVFILEAVGRDIVPVDAVL